MKNDGDDGLRRMTQKHFFHCLYSIMRSMSNTPDKLDNGYEERRLSLLSSTLFRGIFLLSKSVYTVYTMLKLCFRYFCFVIPSFLFNNYRHASNQNADVSWPSVPTRSRICMA